MSHQSGHPGFEVVAADIARKTNPRTGKPYGMDRARAILASAERSRSRANAQAAQERAGRMIRAERQRRRKKV